MIVTSDAIFEKIVAHAQTIAEEQWPRRVAEVTMANDGCDVWSTSS
jgi:hypothetical protein